MSVKRRILRTLTNKYHLCMAILACIFYGFPGRKMKIIGITGTSGKTTTAHLTFAILKSAGLKVSLVSTISAEIGTKVIDTGFHVTTPSSWALQKLLSQALKAGSSYVVLEITSHGLDQYRTWGIPISISGITNITHEHLDYHETFKNYVLAKSKILKGNSVSVLNKDDDNFEYLSKKVEGKLVTFSLNSKADVTPKSYNIHLSLVGKFNIENALLACSVASNIGIDKKTIEKGVNEFKKIPGHMEKLENDRGIDLYIDFAHKPDALNKVLLTARELSGGKIIVVFGCAGARDTEKRPMMGEIAAELSDFAVFTAEDPRTEDVKEITRQIGNGAACNGMVESKKTFTYKKLKRSKHYFWRIYDRSEAIDFAINTLARKGDCVLLLGKGHEKSMCFGTKEIPWDERKVAVKALLRST